jgi:hypothetical protein
MKICKIRLKIQQSLCITTKTCTLIRNFKRNFLENYNDSEHAVKTNNAPFFINFPNINKNGQRFLFLFPLGSGPLKNICSN